MVTRLLASGYSAAEAQRMMRRNQAIGGRAGARHSVALTLRLTSGLP